MKEQLKFDSLDAVLKHLSGSSAEIEASASKYRSQLQEFTGHDLSKPVTALDVIKIVQKVFFEAKNGASKSSNADDPEHLSAGTSQPVACVAAPGFVPGY